MTGVFETDTKKEVDFGDIGLELHIEKPILNDDKTIAINGNFTELGQRIQAVVNRYKDIQLTEDNVSYVKTLKGHFTSLRTGIERERKEYKKVYITPASKLIDTMCDELQSIVASGEIALGNQLAEYDQKRKDELTIILKEYAVDSSTRHNLRPEYASQIVLLDKYYNKTQNEEDSADDIERQAAELEKKQNEYDAGVNMICSECEEANLLAQSYIRELQYKSAMEVLLEIKQDKKANDELKKALDAKIENGEKLIIGKEHTTDTDTQKRTRILRVTYKVEQAKLIAKFFKDNEISFEFIND